VSELRDLYQDVILDHNRRPRNRGRLADATHHAEGDNPLCGDQVSLYLRIEDGRIAGVSFEGVGCAISTASASMMTEALSGLTLEQAHALYGAMIDMLTGDPLLAGSPSAEVGKLAVFAGVREYPARVKCATMAWHTLEAALAGRGEKATE